MRPSHRRRCRVRIARLEWLEPRELLSAAPVYDFWIGDQILPKTGAHAELSPAIANAHALTGLDEAREAYGFAGAGQTVAVIDTGIAYTHDALGGGYGPGYRVVGGWDFTKNTADAFDTGPYGSHGTHVAGIVGSDDPVHTGVAPEVDLVALRVFDDHGGGYFSWVEQALWWVHENQSAFENPITTVNLSLGTHYNAAAPPAWAMLEDALAQLEADGIFVAVAAGNSFAQFNAPGLSYPATSPHVVPVGSVDAGGALSSFSQRHPRMIAAPGRAIMSTVPDYMGDYNGIDDDFARYSGTSMAAPYVAGASVLLREAYAFAGIDHVNQSTLYNLMYSTADTFFDAATQQHYRRLNLQTAFDAVMPAGDYGSTVHTAHSLGTLTDTLSLTGHISRLDDADWFQFTAGAAGTVTVTVDPTLRLAPQWKTDGFSYAAGDGGRNITFDVAAGQTYRFGLGTADGLGHYTLHAGLNAAPGAGALLDVQFADVTGNGLPDIVGRSAHDGAWWVAVNHGSGNYTNQQWGRWSPHVTWTDVVTGDFNGNGRDDIAGRVAETGDWWLALGNGSGSFTNQRWGRWSPNVTWTDVVVGDFNGDGRDDIAGRVATNGDWWLALSNAGGSFTNQRWGRWSPNVTWTDVVVGDFSGDGRDDIAGRVAHTGDWWLALSNAGGGFTNQRAGRWSPNVTWNDVMAGDFTGDGRADVAGRVAHTGDWWIAKSNGNGGFTNERWGRWSPNVTWTDVMAGDFTGNGRADIAGRVAANGDWWVANSNGANGFTNERWGRASAPAGWEYVVVGNHTPTAAGLRTASAAMQSLPAPPTPTAAPSFGQLEALAYWAGFTPSKETLRLGHHGPAETAAPFGSLPRNAGTNPSLTGSNAPLASRSKPLTSAGGERLRLPGATDRPDRGTVERIDLLAEALDALIGRPGREADGLGFMRLRASWGAAGELTFPAGEPGEPPSWDALLDTPTPDAASLDAFYATLE